MKLIIGLGNPGVQYQKTRHNAGFLVVDTLINHYGYNKHQQAFQADIFITKINNEAVIFAKPLTFMNLSGQTVRQLVDYYKVPMEDILIIHDEKDFPSLRFQFKLNGSAGGHNGLKNIIQFLKTDNFKRLRIGIDKPNMNQDLADYVLSSFSNEEQLNLHQNLKTIIPFLNDWTRHQDFNKIMNAYNHKI